MTMKRSAETAPSFPLKSAPPWPLRRLSAGSTSSAPSTARSSSRPTSSTTGIPAATSISELAWEVGTAVTRRPSAARAGSPSMKKRAVVPVPTPRSIPLSTCCSARSAAARFCTSCSDNRLSQGLDAGRDALWVAEHRAAGHQQPRPGRHDLGSALAVDAPVHLDVQPRSQLADAPDLVGAGGDETLAPGAGLHRHPVAHGDVAPDLSERLRRGRGI